MSEYKLVLWEEVKPGDVVYLSGTHAGRFKAYGPHTVLDPKMFLLQNMDGKKFAQYSQDLLVKI